MAVHNLSATNLDVQSPDIFGSDAAKNLGQLKRALEGAVAVIIFTDGGRADPAPVFFVAEPTPHITCWIELPANRQPSEVSRVEVLDANRHVLGVHPLDSVPGVAFPLNFPLQVHKP